ncbi:MBL fold metallo-hydrolase [Cytophagaceae bacterium DM2B3-1]|uniref:MBL fold metallo-hydrolase n=1 Tax=Xanthocytophaga flava TaxID=3048013 RepID=A0ABT7CX73_9BACT|nr:MBL fold metallo-hydrolase [Xanthocytophaga flavus]MDJ1467497.1 MBL fold metallo-hydrolase [Xanthocytophaga flavus]MDJ1498378.1 MBL fold metallo-hydrolase [Xanthocytophaga flavus]
MENLVPVSYTSNPALLTILPVEKWKGTPLDAKGRFINHEFPFWPYLKDVLKWQTEHNPYKEIKKQERWHLPVRKDNSFLTSSDDVIVWLGHATFFIRINGVTLLTDPVFGNAGPVKRKAALPVAALDIKGLDYVLISHNHRDHCDKPSLKIVASQNPQTTYLTGLRMKGLLQDFTKSTQIQEAGWYQQYITDNSKIKIYYLPSRHWARRGLTDTNTQLWGAYIIEAGGKTIYFSGDTGYGNHLKQVGELFPQIDYCIIGVGAFAPRWFMGSNHIAPDDAVKGFHEMSAKNMIPMHYGTFDLSDEPLSEPQRMLIDLKEKGQINGELKLLDIGEVLSIG